MCFEFRLSLVYYQSSLGPISQRQGVAVRLVSPQEEVENQLWEQVPHRGRVFAFLIAF